jgi:hypothetical protein
VIPQIKLKQSHREYIVQVGCWVLVAIVACFFVATLIQTVSARRGLAPAACGL